MNILNGIRFLINILIVGFCIYLLFMIRSSLLDLSISYGIGIAAFIGLIGMIVTCTVMVGLLSLVNK